MMSSSSSSSSSVMRVVLLAVFVCMLEIVLGFPESESPVVGEPPVPVRSTSGTSCTVTAILDAPCNGYNLVFNSPFTLPDEATSACPSDKWSQIVLTLDSSVNGTQYDRFGAVWINGLEVLRLTTPEPTPNGIAWHTERDISYAKNYLLENKDSLSMYLTIPNNVDSTYTGVFLTTITLTFYVADTPDVSALSLTLDIVPLTKAALQADSYPWDNMQVVGTQALTYSLSDVASRLSEQTQSRRTNGDAAPVITGLYAEIFASAHGCEEFYYSNLPNDNATTLGYCGGGVYREINVFIDNVHAGSTYPFPVLYSGSGYFCIPIL
jgi:hypothetical protein